MPTRPPFTTSFLSICGRAKDNRILPSGFLSLAGHLNLEGTAAESWKFELVSTGRVAVR